MLINYGRCLLLKRAALAALSVCVFSAMALWTQNVPTRQEPSLAVVDQKWQVLVDQVLKGDPLDEADLSRVIQKGLADDATPVQIYEAVMANRVHEHFGLTRLPSDDLKLALKVKQRIAPGSYESDKALLLITNFGWGSRELLPVARKFVEQPSDFMACFTACANLVSFGTVRDAASATKSLLVLKERHSKHASVNFMLLHAYLQQKDSKEHGKVFLERARAEGLEYLRKARPGSSGVPIAKSYLKEISKALDEYK